MKHPKIVWTLGVCAACTALCLGAQDSEQGVAFFKRHYMQRGNYKDRPLPGETVEALALFAARGEYEPAQFLMRASGRVEDVSVVLENDLVEKGSAASIPKSEVDIRIVVDQKRWLDSRRFIREPYLLMKRDTFTLQPDETTRVWLTVHVPEKTAAGAYASTLRVAAGYRALQTIAVNVTVWPFALEDHGPDRMMRMMYFGNSPLPVWGRNLAYLTKMYRDMAEHGMNSITCYAGQAMHPEATAAKSPGKRWSSLTEEVAAMKAGGLLQQGSAFIWLYAWSFPAPYLTESHAFLEEQGLEVFLYSVDEPGNKQRQESARRLAAGVRKKFPTAKLTTAIGEEGIEAVGDTLEAWICSAAHLSDHMTELAEEKGKKLWSYDCGLGPTDPLTSRNYFGFRVWRTGARGASHWCYNEGHGGVTRFRLPVRDWDAYNPDYQSPFNFVFCVPEGPIPSIGWEGVREGVDDYRYIVTLENHIAKAEAAGKGAAAATGKQLLAELRAKIDPENYRKALEVSRESKGHQAHCYTRPAPEPKLAVEDYDAYRQRLAQAIIAISASLAK